MFAPEAAGLRLETFLNEITIAYDRSFANHWLPADCNDVGHVAFTYVPQSRETLGGKSDLRRRKPTGLAGNFWAAQCPGKFKLKSERVLRPYYPRSVTACSKNLAYAIVLR